MKTKYICDIDAPKRPVNLSANSSLISRAQQAGINLSQTFEEALINKLRRTLEGQWLAENKDAIRTYNSRIDRHGVFGASKRRF